MNERFCEKEDLERLRRTMRSNESEHKGQDADRQAEPTGDFMKRLQALEDALDKLIEAQKELIC